MPDPFLSATTSRPSERGPGPARGRRHRAVLGTVTAVLALTIGAGWASSSGGVDGVVVRLWLLLAVVTAIAMAVASGFDRRYPAPSIGAVALRAVSLASTIGVLLAVVADPFVQGPADGGDPVATAVIGATLAAAVIGAGWYGGRGESRTPAGPRRPTPRTGAAAVVIVAIPVVVGQVAVAFLIALCGSSTSSLLWLATGLVTPVTLAVVERGLGRRFPMAGLAASVGRLVLVAALQVTILVVVATTATGASSCESTIGPGIPLVAVAQ